MGLSIKNREFVDEDYRRFGKRLNQNLLVLEKLLQQPGFGECTPGRRKIGCELELYLVNQSGDPAFYNQEILESLNDPLLTLELNRYNLEYNLKPVALQRSPFQTAAKATGAALDRINRCAAEFSCSAIPIGILPTLNQSHLGSQAMTNLARYHVLTRELRAIRGGPFSIQINGEDPIHTTMDDVTLEGANTSLQIHYQVSPASFADTYNALQLVTPLVVAISGNSPLLFGHRLWQETRIPLFKQSIDCRRLDPTHLQPARVNFGHGWVRETALEIFTEAVRLYRPLLPECSDEDAMACLRAGSSPQLHELRLQQGCVWLWNRPVYDPAEGGHLRIEMRALPAGPSVKDMIANTALIIGLTEVMKPRIRSLLSVIPFEYCAQNFYRAAEYGLDAKLVWPSHTQNEPDYQMASSIIAELLEDVPEALDAIGVCRDDYLPQLSIIKARLANRQTGSVWQTKMLKQLKNDLKNAEALQQLVLRYQTNSQQNIPVHEWSLH